MNNLNQPLLFDLSSAPFSMKSSYVLDAINELSNSNEQDRGAVFTRPEIAEFMLDLAGYRVEHPLHKKRILEPSFGGGGFLLPIIERLTDSWRKNGTVQSAYDDLKDTVRAVELHKNTFEQTRTAVLSRLQGEGITGKVATAIADKWLIHADFLLQTLNEKFDYVVGNPPYVRQERIPSVLLSEYRQNYTTMYDRADLYIPFFERSLSLLAESGSLVFICADRWMKNRYGKLLRKFITQRFHVKACIDMVNAEAFKQEVSAYPAIVVIAKEHPGTTRVVQRQIVSKYDLASISADLLADSLPIDSNIREVKRIGMGTLPWLLGSTEQMNLLEQLENLYPALESAGCKVGIGVATGADSVFIGNVETLDVETDRILPLATTRDIRDKTIFWQGSYVVNPFNTDGTLVNLAQYPRLARYFEIHREQLLKRHCARKMPTNWFRTIDRIWPDLAATPKLLIPDIKDELDVAYEPGRLYPHHNLYYIVSNSWDLRALQTVLLSDLAKFFILTYSTQIRGGYLRFQAQYLRRIRIPDWQQIGQEMKTELIEASATKDLDICNRTVYKLYRLNSVEQSLITGAVNAN